MDPRADCDNVCCCWSNDSASHPPALAAASAALPRLTKPQDAACGLATHSGGSSADVVRSGSSSRRISEEAACSPEARELSAAVLTCKGCAQLGQSGN